MYKYKYSPGDIVRSAYDENAYLILKYPDRDITNCYTAMVFGDSMENYPSGSQILLFVDTVDFGYFLAA